MRGKIVKSNCQEALMSNNREVVIVDAVRSATAKPNSRLSRFHVTDLLGDVLQSLFERNKVDPSAVDHVAGGCIAQVGEQANNVTRTAWLAAGLPLHVGASTTSTQCGSGQHANTWAHSLIGAGMADIVVVCGVESMSHVPMASQIPEMRMGKLTWVTDIRTGIKRCMTLQTNLRELSELRQNGI